MTIVAVTGGRTYAREDLVFRAFNYFHSRRPISLIVSGACVDEHTGAMSGADWLAIKWALAAQVDFNGRPARWRADGYPQGGPIRNGRMLRTEHPEYLIAFPGGRGTFDCTKQAVGLGVIVLPGEAPEAWGVLP
jgi:hypothetical protein